MEVKATSWRAKYNTTDRLCNNAAVIVSRVQLDESTRLTMGQLDGKWMAEST